MRFSRRYWINIARFVGVMLIPVLVGFGVYLARFGIQLANQSMHPAPTPLDWSPDEAGITDYKLVSFSTQDGLTLEVRWEVRWEVRCKYA